MTSVPANQNATHKSGTTPTVTPSTAPKDASNSQANNNTSTTGDSAYPEQKHAGSVGYGPNYHSGPTLEKKIKGLKEEIKGKVTHNRDLVQHGRDLLSGEERRKQLTGEDEPNPFQNADEDDSKDKDKETNKVEGGDKPAASTDSTQVQTGHEFAKSKSPQQHHSTSQSQTGKQALNETYTDQPRVQATPPSHTQQTSGQTSTQDQPSDGTPRHQSQPLQPADIDSSKPASSTDSATRAANVALPPSSYEVNKNNEFHTPDSHRPSPPRQPHGQTDKYPMTVNTASQMIGGGNLPHPQGEKAHQSHSNFGGQGNTQTSSQLLRPESGIDRSGDEAPVHIEGGFKTQGGQPKANPFGMAVNQGHGQGAKEQAATVAPEGTKDAEKQRQGNYTDFVADAANPSPRQ